VSIWSDDPNPAKATSSPITDAASQVFNLPIPYIPDTSGNWD